MSLLFTFVNYIILWLQLLQDLISHMKAHTASYPREAGNTDEVWWAGRRSLETPAPAGTVRKTDNCEGNCRCERTPRVTAGSTDDDKDLDVPTDRVLVDVERLDDTASSLRLPFNTEYDITQCINVAKYQMDSKIEI